MLVSFVITVALLIAAISVARIKLGISEQDIDIMFLGSVAFFAIQNLAKILTGVILGMTMGQFLAYLVALLINVAFGYYFFRKSGL